jgi:hypothetical protein
MAIGYQAFAVMIRKKELPVLEIYDVLRPFVK